MGGPCPRPRGSTGSERLRGRGVVPVLTAELAPPCPLPTALMEVHEDFFLYQGGIYSHTPVSLGRPERYRRHGTHSVKITG